MLSILRYLKETISFGLFIPKSLSPHFQAFADSDWAGDPDDRRSVGAYCIYLGSSLIAWTCKQQEALANAAAELQWLCKLCNDLGSPPTQKQIIWCDNIGAAYFSANPLFHARTKHIEIDFHFVRDLVHSKESRSAFSPQKIRLMTC